MSDLNDAELIRFIAEKVMGWTYRTGCWMQMGKYKGAPVWVTMSSDFRPTVSWSDAGMVVERMKEIGFWCRMEVEPSGSYYSRFRELPGFSDRTGACYEKSLGRAVCCAARAALEGK